MRLILFFFFFKQKTAYEVRISDWSSDVCSSDLQGRDRLHRARLAVHPDKLDIVLRAVDSQWDFTRGPRVLERHHHAVLDVVPSATRRAGERRSAERRVGKGWVSTWRTRWSPGH